MSVTRRNRSFLLVSCLIAAAALTAAAFAGGTGARKASHVKAFPDLAYVKTQIAKFRVVPKFTAPGAAFAARPKEKGKKLFVIPASSNVPFVQTIADGMQRIAKQIGISFVEWRNPGQPSAWQQGMNAAIAQHANSIDLLAGIDPAVLQPQIVAAKKKGISTVVSHLYDIAQKSAPNVAALVNIPYNQAGRLLGDWA